MGDSLGVLRETAVDLIEDYLSFNRGGRVGHGLRAVTKNVVTVTFIVAPDTKIVVALKPMSRFHLTKCSHAIVMVAFFVATL